MTERGLFSPSLFGNLLIVRFPKLHATALPGCR